MISISQYYFRTHVLYLLRSESLYSRFRSHWHEGRGMYVSVESFYNSGPAKAIFYFFLNFKFHYLSTSTKFSSKIFTGLTSMAFVKGSRGSEITLFTTPNT